MKPTFDLHQHPIVPAESHHNEPHVTYQVADVKEAHEALGEVLSGKPANLHDNHQHISAILDKLRNGEDTADLKWHRRSKRSLLGKWKTKTEDDEAFHPTVISHEDRWLAGWHTRIKRN